MTVVDTVDVDVGEESILGVAASDADEMPEFDFAEDALKSGENEADADGVAEAEYDDVKVTTDVLDVLTVNVADDDDEVEIVAVSEMMIDAVERILLDAVLELDGAAVAEPPVGVPEVERFSVIVTERVDEAVLERLADTVGDELLDAAVVTEDDGLPVGVADKEKESVEATEFVVKYDPSSALEVILATLVVVDDGDARAVAENLPDAVYEIDDDGEIVGDAVAVPVVVN